MTDIANRPSWTERITGRWAISWQVIVVGALISWPQMVLTGGTLGSHPVDPADMPTIALVTGAFLIANSLYSWLAMVTVFRNRAFRNVPLALYVAFYVSAAVLPVLGMETSDRILGQQAALPLTVRLFFAALTTLWLGIAFSYVLDGRDRFRRERDLLISEAVQAELATLRESAAASALRRDLDDHVAASLSDTRALLTSASLVAAGTGPRGAADLTGPELDELTESLTAAAESAVRPLSHRLWQQAEHANPRPRFRRVARLVWRQPTYLPMATAYVIAIGLPGASVRGFGPLAPLALIVLGAVLILLMRLSERVSVAAPPLRRASYWICFLLMLCLVLAYALVPGDVTAPGSDAGAILIGLPVGVLLTSYIAALGTERQLALASLQETVTRREVEQEAQRTLLAAQMRSVARELHGTVQTQLIACAAAIDRARSTGDSGELISAIHRVGAIVQGGDAREPLTLGERLSRCANAWDGLMQVQLDVDPALTTSTGGDAIVEVVEEALANAHRHGGAARVDVTVTATSRTCSIEVVDDGIGVPSGASDGLGTALMRQRSGGRLRLHREHDKTVLQLTLDRPE